MNNLFTKAAKPLSVAGLLLVLLGGTLLSVEVKPKSEVYIKTEEQFNKEFGPYLCNQFHSMRVDAMSVTIFQKLDENSIRRLYNLKVERIAGGYKESFLENVKGRTDKDGVAPEVIKAYNDGVDRVVRDCSKWEY